MKAIKFGGALLTLSLAVSGVAFGEQLDQADKAQKKDSENVVITQFDEKEGVIRIHQVARKHVPAALLDKANKLESKVAKTRGELSNEEELSADDLAKNEARKEELSKKLEEAKIDEIVAKGKVVGEIKITSNDDDRAVSTESWFCRGWGWGGWVRPWRWWTPAVVSCGPVVWNWGWSGWWGGCGWGMFW